MIRATTRAFNDVTTRVHMLFIVHRESPYAAHNRVVGLPTAERARRTVRSSPADDISLVEDGPATERPIPAPRPAAAQHEESRVSRAGRPTFDQSLARGRYEWTGNGLFTRTAPRLQNRPVA